MPIFDNNGKKQNVQDVHVEKYMELYPDATTIMEREGKKYRVKAKDYNTFLGDTLEAPKMESAPQMEDNYSKLYKAMVNSGYDTADLGGSEDDFRREMQDSTTRKNFYDWVSNNEMNGFRIGSYDAYEERLAPNKATVSQAHGVVPNDKSSYTFTAEEFGMGGGILTTLVILVIWYKLIKRAK